MARAGELERPAALGSPVLAAALAAVAGAWAYLAYASSGGGGFLAAFAMWNVMMVAMMLPSLVPWVGLFSPREAALFSAGYFVVWAAYCAAAAVVQVSVGDALVVPRPAGGLVLIAAGVFELTPLKAACLDRCRSPLGRLLAQWREGAGLFFRIGLSHGLDCLGCCWALMALAFALGTMDLAWMAALTAVVAVEKLAPWGEPASRVLGVGLVVWGSLVVVS